MKIAVLTSGILPVPAVQGGAVENLIDFYLEYNNEHHLHDITVFSAYHPAVKRHSARHSSSNNYKYIKTNSIWFKILRRVYRRYYPKGYYHSSIELYFELIARQLEKQSFDLFILENRPAFALKLRKRFPDTPIICHLHTNMVHTREPKAKDIINSTSAFIVVSEYLRKEIENVNVPIKIDIVYNGIDTTKFDVKASPIERKKLGFNDNDFIAIFTGRLVKDKGIKELLLAIKEINDSHVKLLVVGAEDFSKEAEHSAFYSELLQISKSIEGRVTFTGFVPYQELPQYLVTANVMVVPSHINEAFGMACIEASAMGLPVIATNEGGIPEALIGQKHILIEKEQDLPIQIANAILEVKNNYTAYAGNLLNPTFTKETYAKSFFECVTKLM
jgi:glycosyltransferase involved in cell wall biosynthesis